MIRITTSALVVVFIIALASAALYAQDTNSNRARLESRINLIQAQIDSAKSANQRALEQRLQGLQSSIDNLIRQRVSIDAQIAAIQGQIEDAKKRANENLARQINQYENTLNQVKSQMSQSGSIAPGNQTHQRKLESQVAATQKTGTAKSAAGKK